VSQILIAVDHRENARLLAEYLDQYYTTIIPTSVNDLALPFDLGVFDGYALNRLWPQIQSRKFSEQPVFLPILLVTPRQDISMMTRQLWQSIDEIIFTPIEKTELFVRAEVLLRARQLSVELQTKNLTLQAEIATRTEAEQLLRESEERFRAALKNSPIVVSRMDRDLRYTWVYNELDFQALSIIGKRDNEIANLTNTDDLIALKQSVFETKTGARQEIEVMISEQPKSYDVSVEPILEGEEVIGLRTAALDITERKLNEQRIVSLYKLTAELSRSLTLEEVASTIIDYAMSALGASAGSVYLVNAEKRDLEIVTSVGYSESVTSAWQRLSLNHEGVPLADAVRMNTPLLYGTIDEWTADYPLPVGISERHKAWASLPFSLENRVLGGLALSFPTTRSFDDGERQFMMTLAHQCAQALERVKLNERIKESAVVAERHRLARELHDAVTQTLFAAATIADAVPVTWGKNSERAQELLKQVTSLNRSALAEMRTLLLELRPDAIVKTDLNTLLTQLLQALKGKKLMETQLSVTGPEVDLPEDIHIALYRIAQESLNNIVKHSQATQIHVIVNYSTECLVVRIEDNGQGFDPRQRRSGLGLEGMRERAESLGLWLQIQSAPGQGTVIEITWPLVA
jgi:signal transduction histidine kinase